MWWAKRSLRQKVTLSLLSCSLSVALFLGIFITRFAIHDIHDNIEEKLEAISTSRADEYHTAFEKLKTDTENLANSKFIQDALVGYESVAYGTGLDITSDTDLSQSPYFKTINDRFSESLGDYLSSSPFNSFAIALNGGSVVSQTGAQHLIGKNLATGTLKTARLSQCFSTARSSDRMFTDLFIDFDQKGRAYICQIIRSKYDRDGYKKNAAMGVLIAEVNWNLFNKIALFKSGLGETGEVALSTTDGGLRSLPRTIAATGSASGASLTNEQVTDLAKGLWSEKIDLSLRKMHEAVDHSGKPISRMLRPFNLDDKTQWVVLTQVQTDEVNKSAHAMQAWSMLLLGISGIVILIFGFWFSNTLGRQFGENSDRITSTSQDVDEVTQQVSEVAYSVQAGTHQQSSAIHETSVSLEELTQMVARTAELSFNSKEKSSLCSSQAETGLEKINHLMTSIEKVERSSQLTLAQVDRANKSFEELLNLFKTITSKTQVINDIAFQTKLLSFNASVEAARAGEHGRGFSIVAQEVGNLAVSVSGAASEINRLLETSAAKMDKVIDENRVGLQRATSDTRAEVSASQSLAVECHQFFASLSQLVREINESVAQISSASGEQKTGIGEIHRAVGQISLANDENGRQADLIFNLAEKLQRVVSDLSTAKSQLQLLIKGEHAFRSMSSSSEAGPQSRVSLEAGHNDGSDLLSEVS